MEKKLRKTMLLLMFLMVAELCGRSNAVCQLSKVELLACKPAVDDLDPVFPSSACCAALSRADLMCFCSLKNSMLLPSMGVDPELAMQLPAKCELDMPGIC